MAKFYFYSIEKFAQFANLSYKAKSLALFGNNNEKTAKCITFESENFIVKLLAQLITS